MHLFGLCLLNRENDVNISEQLHVQMVVFIVFFSYFYFLFHFLHISLLKPINLHWFL